MKFNHTETLSLFKRVYNSKLEKNDDVALTEIIKAVFGDGSMTPDPSALHQFNNLIMETANPLIKPKLQDLLAIFAQYKSANPGDTVVYKVPKTVKARFKRHAPGSDVLHVRVDDAEKVVAEGIEYSVGFTYEGSLFVEDPLGTFRQLVDDVVEAMARKLFEEAVELIKTAVETTEIPANNVLAGSDLKLKDYNKVAGRLARYGGRPVFIADTLLIDHFAEQQATVGGGNLITDSMIEGIVRDMSPTVIGRTNAVSLINPFEDKTNTKTEYPVNVGYLLASEGNTKPLAVTTFGGLKQLTDTSYQTEAVNMKVIFKADVSLLHGELVGKVTENTAVTV